MKPRIAWGAIDWTDPDNTSANFLKSYLEKLEIFRKRREERERLEIQEATKRIMNRWFVTR